MGKSCIIGHISNYTWDDAKYWVNSIRRSGFEGDVVATGTNLKKETITKLSDEGVILSLNGKVDADGDVVTNGALGSPHVERFFYIWHFLKERREDYDYVVMTDTRDVVFQSNPETLLKTWGGYRKLVVSSEGMCYKDEPWGAQNLVECFGAFFANDMKDHLIYNVGVIGGRHAYVRDMALMIFQMSLNRPTKIVDQAVFNFLLQQQFFGINTLFTNNDDAWAIQLGTTLGAVTAGAGDLGKACVADAEAMAKYMITYVDKQPVIKDGIVSGADGKPFAIVHQYDRLEESIAADIRKRYE